MKALLAENLGSVRCVTTLSKEPCVWNFDVSPPSKKAISIQPQDPNPSDLMGPNLPKTTFSYYLTRGFDFNWSLSRENQDLTAIELLAVNICGLKVCVVIQRANAGTPQVPKFLFF